MDFGNPVGAHFAALLEIRQLTADLRAENAPEARRA
jgi:hypothetical protein